MSSATPPIIHIFVRELRTFGQVTFAAPAARRRKLQVWNFACKSLWPRPLQSHSKSRKILCGFKENLVRTYGGRTLVAYSSDGTNSQFNYLRWWDTWSNFCISSDACAPVMQTLALAVTQHRTPDWNSTQKYLGITFNHRMDWSEHVATVCKMSFY